MTNAREGGRMASRKEETEKRPKVCVYTKSKSERRAESDQCPPRRVRPVAEMVTSLRQAAFAALRRARGFGLASE